ncbi:Zn-dependent protease with chaperone function [Micromonospora pisi]|uniref:Zn-dependent protease with chaperone function n=1 Tax=Micromonospora pisi TaxID=589240 RepID=A0A495JTJ7_9ACTN|nr:M48 family metalloprotease [Micromonospora pisi]RKR92330.1 Zn-dependent protease with chaperone function [Micromonospora pisi]
MTGPAAPDRARAARPTARLGWMYLLVVAALAAIGVTAGDLYFLADRSLHLPWALALDGCEQVLAASGQVPAPSTLADCLAGVPRQRGLVMLGGAVLVPVGAALLLLLVPLVDQRRLRRQRGRFEVPGATARFAALCDENQLRGRRRPRLLIAGPPFRQAFTTGGIGRRPVVVLPAGVAVAYRDPGRFDPVVQHELAHVRAGDVTAVAAIRGLIWLPVPAVAVGALIEIFSFGPNVFVGRAVLRALLLSVLIAVLGALLMRIREREADLHVVRTGNGNALIALLATARERVLPAGNRPKAVARRLLARHPDPTRRAELLRRPDRLREGGLAQGLAVATVTVAAMVAAFEVTAELRPSARGWLPALVTVWTGAVLLTSGFMPSLVRRAEAVARTGARADWWRPLAGVGIGFFATTVVTAWFPTPGGAGLFQGQTREAGASLLLALLTSALGTGAVGLCVLLATTLAVGPSPEPGGRGTATDGRARTDSRDGRAPVGSRDGWAPVGNRWRYAGYATAIGVTVAVLWPMPVLASVWNDPGVLRAWLVYALPRTGWLLPALALPVLLAARARPAGPVHLRRLARSAEVRAVVLTVLICGGGAALHTGLNPPDALPEALRALQARWLICALAGWLVLLVTATYPGRGSLARPVLAAGAATGLTAVLQYAQSALAGGAAGLDALQLHLVAPLTCLLYLFALSLPPLLARRTVARLPALAQPPAPAPAPAASAPAPAGGLVPLVPSTPPTMPWLVRVALPATVATVVMLGPGAATLYTPLPSQSGAAAPAARLLPHPTAPTGPVTADPAQAPGPGPTPTVSPLPAAGRPLDTVEVDAVVRAVRSAVPTSWTARRSGSDSGSRIEPARCEPLFRDAYLEELKPGVRASAEAGYASPRGRVGVASTTVDVTVTSYAEPVPSSLFVAADAARAACRQFTAGEGGSAVRFTVGARPAPVLGEESWRVDYALSVGSGGNRITGTSAFVLVRVGHNLVTVYLSAVMQPLDERILGAVLTAAVRALDPP